MRVYQFRHIRAERQCSQADYGPWAALATRRSRSRNTAFKRLTYHDGRAAGSPHLLARPRRARDRLRARGAAGSGGRARRGRRLALAEAARDDDVARRPAGADAGAGERPGEPREEDRGRCPRRADPLALPAGRERDGGRRPERAARPADVAAGGRDRLSERALPAAARSQPAADRRARSVGPRARKRRPGDQDRDHRRGDRPDAPVLLARRATRCPPATRRARRPTRPRR